MQVLQDHLTEEVLVVLQVFQVAEYVYLQSVGVPAELTIKQELQEDPEVAEVTVPVLMNLVVVQLIKELKELEVQNPVEAAELLQEQIT